MIKYLLNILVCIIIGVSISSCDEGHTKDYFIQNELITKIKVNFKVEEILDSMIIEPNTKQLLYSHLYFFGKVGVDDDRYNDVISDIVIQVDTVTRELDESLWEYEEVGKYYAKYTMLVD